MEKHMSDTDISTMHTLYIPGQADIAWAEGDQAAIDKAKVAFDQAKVRGMAAYSLVGSDTGPVSGGGTDGTVIQQFDPKVDIRMMTQTAGG